MVYLEPIKTNIITKKKTAYSQYASKSHISLTSIYTIFLFQISFMSRNAQIICVPGYSFISSESCLLFSRSSTVRYHFTPCWYYFERWPPCRAYISCLCLIYLNDQPNLHIFVKIDKAQNVSTTINNKKNVITYIKTQALPCLSTSGVRSPPGWNDLVSFCHYLAFIVVRPSDLSYILMKDRAYITVA
jgi:hypothetical protein